MDNAESQYLDDLHSLTSEINAAMKAIASDNPASFAESIARQELHVFSLATLRDLQKGTLPPDVIGAAIQTAERDLLQASQRYAALLKHSGKTITILSALCDSHLGVRKEARGDWPGQQTWSCEM